jgi:DNA polymerase I
VISEICGSTANYKKIPIFLLDNNRANIILDSYFKGDGNFNIRGRRRYSTASRQLTNDLVTILGSLGKYPSVHTTGRIYRVVETKGWNYRRKFRGLIDFNGTNLVRIKSVEVDSTPQSVYDLETENGWFVSSNGIVVHNSYGVMGSEAFSFYCPPVAESTTALGRHAIRETIKEAEKLGVSVLYGDTDSIFLDNPTQVQIDRLEKWSQEVLGIELEKEKVYRWLALSSRKKNYLGVYEDGSVDIRGLLGKKRNTPLFLQEAFREMTKVLCKLKTREEIEEIKKVIIKILRESYRKLENHEYKLEELVFRVQLTRSPKSYVKTTPQHVKAARQLEDRGKKVPGGSIISFVKTTGSPGVRPLELARIEEIDVGKYKEHVKSTFGQVLDAMDIDLSEITGTMRLDAFT